MKCVAPDAFHDDFVRQLDEFTDALAAVQRAPTGLWGSAVLSAVDRLGRQSKQATVDAVHAALEAPRVLVVEAVGQAELAGLLRTRNARGHLPVLTLTASGRAAVESARRLLAEVGHANAKLASRAR